MEAPHESDEEESFSIVASIIHRLRKLLPFFLVAIPACTPTTAPFYLQRNAPRELPDKISSSPIKPEHKERSKTGVDKFELLKKRLVEGLQEYFGPDWEIVERGEDEMFIYFGIKRKNENKIRLQVGIDKQHQAYSVLSTSGFALYSGFRDDIQLLIRFFKEERIGLDLGRLDAEQKLVLRERMLSELTLVDNIVVSYKGWGLPGFGPQEHIPKIYIIDFAQANPPGHVLGRIIIDQETGEYQLLEVATIKHHEGIISGTLKPTVGPTPNVSEIIERIKGMKK